MYFCTSHIFRFHLSEIKHDNLVILKDSQGSGGSTQARMLALQMPDPFSILGPGSTQSPEALWGPISNTRFDLGDL